MNNTLGDTSNLMIAEKYLTMLSSLDYGKIRKKQV